MPLAPSRATPAWAVLRSGLESPGLRNLRPQPLPGARDSSEPVQPNCVAYLERPSADLRYLAARAEVEDRLQSFAVLGVLVMAAASAAQLPFESLEKASLRLHEDPFDRSEQARTARVLRPYVAAIYIVRSMAEDETTPWGNKPLHTGFGVAVSATEVRCAATSVKDAVSIEVHGSKGRISAKLIVVDLDRNVARLRLRGDIGQVGLTPVEPLPDDRLRPGLIVFALVSAEPNAEVVFGKVLEVGPTGARPLIYARTELDVADGMPVFDAQRRWVGLPWRSAAGVPLPVYEEPLVVGSSDDAREEGVMVPVRGALTPASATEIRPPRH